MEKKEQGLRIKSPKQKNKSIFIEENRIYNELHQCQLLDSRLEKIRSFLQQKYDCDYLAVHFFNEKNDLFFSNLSHDKWHNKYWRSYISNCMSLQMSSNLKMGQNGFLFFFDLSKGANDTRAEIVGERKEGFSVMFHQDDTGNKIQFCLTFKNGKNIDTFSRSVLQNLLSDLRNSQRIVDDFMEYFDLHGEIEDSTQLNSFIQKRNYSLRM